MGTAAASRDSSALKDWGEPPFSGTRLFPTILDGKDLISLWHVVLFMTFLLEAFFMAYVWYHEGYSKGYKKGFKDTMILNANAKYGKDLDDGE